MRNFSKLLCVALALIIALSAASCSLSKGYSYKTDDVELPIGVYIYYLNNAYNQAQTYAQKSDLYDSEAGTYDGSASFLKMEITDDDGVTAVAEQWILDKAADYMRDAVAVYAEYNKLGATLDEATVESYKSYYTSYWEQSLAESFEGYGVSYDSFVLAGITIPMMRSAVFEAEYSTGGPLEVPDDELQTYFEGNYTSYKYFSADLYTTESADDGETSTAVALSDEEIAELEDDFKGYADDINDGSAFSSILEEYNTDYSAEATATENVSNIDEDTEDEIMKEILSLKEGEAKSVTIGDTDTTKKVYVIYKAPIASEENYLEDSNNRLNVLSDMKTDDFDDLLKTIYKDLKVDISSACASYKPSMFES